MQDIPKPKDQKFSAVRNRNTQKKRTLYAAERKKAKILSDDVDIGLIQTREKS